MEIELRVILLIVGLVILCIVGMDLYRRRRPVRQAANRPIMDPVVNDNIGNQYHDDMLQFAATTQNENIDAINYETMSYEITQPEILESEDLYQAETHETELKNIISINIMARDPYGFNGQDLLNAVKAANMHFGKNDIFHRHENEDGSGNILFSLVSAIEPGYFFLDTMPQEHVPGVILFLLPENVANPTTAVDKMVRVAKQIAFALNAELLDQNHQPLTLNTIERYQIQAKRCKTL